MSFLGRIRNSLAARPLSEQQIKQLGGKRARLLFAVFVLIFSLCAAQLVNIQIIHGPQYAQAAQQARMSSSTIPAKRGDIVDRKGTILATSVEVYDVSVNQKLVKQYIHREVVDPDGNIVTDSDKLSDPGNTTKIVGTGAAEAARQLASLLEMNAAVLGGKMVGDKGFVYLAKGVSAQIWRQIRELGIDGIDAEVRYEREYPNGATAASILGFIDYEGVGRAGVEATQNEYLSGTPGKYTVEISPSGQIIPGGTQEEVEAKSGQTVQLTIDADLQSLAESSLNAKVEEVGAEWGSAIVQEVGTGKVLALADSGNLTPDEIREGKSDTTGSRSIQYTYEPGSTGKLATFTTALTQQKITPLSVFTVPYQLQVGEEVFHDSHQHATLQLTATGILAQSSNTGTIQIGQLVSDQDRYNDMVALGFGRTTGIEMPGESAGLLSKYDSWDGRQRFTTMFGQGLACTPIQISRLMTTIANYGVEVAPQLVESYIGEQNTITEKASSAPEERIDPDVSATLIKMMQSVVDVGGSAKLADVAGYNVAGKTGTTEVLDSSGRSAGVVASFAGLAPAEDPQVTVTVIIYKPQREIYGGQVAGPVFSEIMSQALRILDVAPSAVSPEYYPLKSQ